MSAITLEKLKPGRNATVLRVKGEGALKRRLIDMGITPGTAVAVRRAAPLGDPLEITLRGYRLTLRKKEASLIEIEEPAKNESKKNETPASKPSAPSKPAETPPETPTETPVEQNTGALSLLTSVWSTYSEDDKFPAGGGDAEHAVDDAPGSFDVSNADSLTYQLTFPSDDVSLIDGAASLVHMMNMNTFTCGAFHVADAGNVSKVADDIRSAVQGKQWMCGFPDKLVIFTTGQYVVSVYGDEDLVNTFRDKFSACHSGAVAVYDEAISG